MAWEPVINDRRGQPKEPRVETIAEPTPTGDTKTWKSVGFMIAMAQGPQGIIVIGRAVGLRGDDNNFVADFILAPIYPEGFDWTKVARQRLETFLGCNCGAGKMCSTHRMYMQQWSEADADRLNRMSAEPMPECLEVLYRAEQARRNPGIVVPR